MSKLARPRTLRPDPPHTHTDSHSRFAIARPPKGSSTAWKKAFDWDNVFWPTNILMAQETKNSTFVRHSEDFLRSWMCANNAANYTRRGRAYNAFSAPLGSTANVAKFCSEVSRVLKPTGCFFIVSYGVPDNRLNYLEKEDIYSWSVTVHTVPKPTVSAAAVPSAEDANGVHYIYICSKGGNAEEG